MLSADQRSAQHQQPAARRPSSANQQPEAALHAFGNICGVGRQEDQMKLDSEAEENLKRLVYTTAANSPKLTPSALLLSVLQQDPDVRIAGYRVITGLVIREWCLREVCLNSEIIRFVTDPTMETTKLGK
ncbi:ARM repeat superfamily protein [Zea mays]|uniref:ARM repeat superfamily protein n=1 Tax=Zea mays TaxID=4577 RepID=A0A1D6MC48_MAIZE|nr:ARM repeat superfamily protein [Zea mays]